MAGRFGAFSLCGGGGQPVQMSTSSSLWIGGAGLGYQGDKFLRFTWLFEREEAISWESLVL